LNIFANKNNSYSAYTVLFERLKQIMEIRETVEARTEAEVVDAFRQGATSSNIEAVNPSVFGHL
jgi:hypothetical protein